jgi:hypothetical protein
MLGLFTTPDLRLTSTFEQHPHFSGVISLFESQSSGKYVNKSRKVLSIIS